MSKETVPQWPSASKPEVIAVLNSLDTVREWSPALRRELKKSIEIADNENPQLSKPIPLSRSRQYSYEFPIPALGLALEWAAASIAQIVDCPVDIAAMSILGAISLATQGHADVVLPIENNMVQPLSLFLVTVAASGERKSAADNLAMRAVKKYEQRLTRDYNSEIRHYRNTHDVWESQRNKALKAVNASQTDMLAAISRCGIEPEAPPLPMVTCPEPTWEGLINLFVDGLPSLGIMTSEGGQFLGGHGMNEEARLRTVTNLSTVWNGEGIKRVRAGKGNSLVLPGRRLTMHLMIQPKIAQRFFSDEEFRDQGILSRILVSHPESLIGTRMQHEVDPDYHNALQHYEAKLTKLFDKPFNYAGNSKELSPRPLPLDAEAIKLWRNYCDTNESSMALGERYENIRAFASKLSEHAARIAGCLTLFYDFNATHISAQYFENAMEIADYFANQAVDQLNESLKDSEITNAEALYEWIIKTWNEPYIGMQVICQRGPNHLRRASAAKSAVAVLEQYNWLKKAGAGVEVNGIMVKEAWEIVRE